MLADPVLRVAPGFGRLYASSSAAPGGPPRSPRL